MATPSLDVSRRVVIDPAKLAAFLREPQGPVLRNMLLRGDKVVAEAKRLVGKKTHNLENHIVKRVVEISGQPVVQVGVVNVPYAIWHHEGTPPHQIRPRKVGGVLRFQSGGQVIYARYVNHPGTKPNRFLTNALRVAS